MCHKFVIEHVMMLAMDEPYLQAPNHTSWGFFILDPSVFTRCGAGSRKYLKKIDKQTLILDERLRTAGK